ncbi:MAG TPA: tRNA (adenosine(37)-N6)-dimethylallyltransferase MiaA [Desulfobacterales bacterium]|nr:tRNA (adenosine(37)-N6)-dimethylallyltransferase MiaA [Desulfobacterales bacterium]
MPIVPKQDFCKSRKNGEGFSIQLIPESADATPFLPVAVITGPTAVGKTALALQVAQELGAEIVSADSLQVYRELDIGSAKPTQEERALTPHHLIDVVFPDEDFDAAAYCRRGRRVLAELHARRVPPLVVGGTGLYIRALLHGIFNDGVQDKTIRQHLQEELAIQGLPVLYDRLRLLDPETAQRLHPHDAFRIQRALEVIAATGQKMSELRQRHRFANNPYRVLKIALVCPREELYARIDCRVEAMLASGLVAEVQDLLKRYSPRLKSLQSLGYRHIGGFLQGFLSWEEAVAQLKRDTRRYAKRQLTWLRSEPDIHLLEPSQISAALKRLDLFFGSWSCC